MKEVSNKILWGIIWTLLLGAYGWTLLVGKSLTAEVIANDRLNTKEHTEIRSTITQYIIPMEKAISRIEAKVDKL